MPLKMAQRRKRLGQVFLRDPLVVEQIIRSAHIAPHETVLEIGPGSGALTATLARWAAVLYAIEVDPHYAQTLTQNFTAFPHINIIQADARTYDYALLPPPLVVVANLPYSVGMTILTHLMHFRQRLSRLIIMLQKEVAERLLAEPGSSAYGTLSVFFHYHTTVQHCFEVSRHAFTPVPSVDSTVLALTPLTPLPWERHDAELLFRVVRSAFAHRRKVLRSNLLTIPGLPLTRTIVAEALQMLHLHESVRAQELHVSQFIQLTEILRRLTHDG